MNFNVLTEKTLFTGKFNKKIFRKGSKIEFKIGGSVYSGEIVEIGYDWISLMMIIKDGTPYKSSMVVNLSDIEEDSCNYAV